MEHVIVSGISVQELVKKIAESLQVKNDQQETPKVKEPSEYLTRKEVARFLKITLPTLHEWSKRGLLQSYRIGNRILYKAAEIQSSVHKVLNNKHRKIN